MTLSRVLHTEPGVVGLVEVWMSPLVGFIDGFLNSWNLCRLVRFWISMLTAERQHLFLFVAAATVASYLKPEI